MNRLIVIIIFLLFVCGNTFSQDEEVQQIQLTTSDVESFIDAFPGIIEEFKKLDIKYDDKNYEFSVAESAEVVNEVNLAVRKYGYKDYSDFYTKAGTISMCYASIKMDKEIVSVQPEIEKAIREIESNNNYSAEQKEQMISLLKQGSQVMNTLSQDMSVQNNIAVVSPYINEIEGVLDTE